MSVLPRSRRRCHFCRRRKVFSFPLPHLETAFVVTFAAVATPPRSHRRRKGNSPPLPHLEADVGVTFSAVAKSISELFWQFMLSRCSVTLLVVVAAVGLLSKTGQSLSICIEVEVSSQVGWPLNQRRQPTTSNWLLTSQMPLFFYSLLLLLGFLCFCTTWS